MTEEPVNLTPARDRTANLTNMGKGRPAGVANKATMQLKTAILLGAVAADAAIRKAAAGPNAAIVEGSLTGYCAWLAEKHPQSFASLLGRVLPIQIKSAGNALDQPGSPITPQELGQALAFALRLGAAGQNAKVIDHSTAETRPVPKSEEPNE